MFSAAFAAVALLSLGGCELDVTSRLGEHPEVAGVELINESGETLTPVVTLEPGGPQAVSARFLDAAGRPIPSFDSHRMSLVWEPAGTARSEPSGTLTHDVTILRSCQPPREVFVGYGHDGRADERIFGPFPVEVPASVGSARIFGPDGEELTPRVRLPSQTPFRIEVRFYDCDGVLVTGLGEDYEALLFFSTPEFATWSTVRDTAFQSIVTIQEPVGRVGLMSVGLRKISAQPYEAFGPFPLTVY